MTSVYQYLRNLFLAFSQLLNVLIGGDPQESLSARCYRQTWRAPMWVINTVAALFKQPHHCRGAYHALLSWSESASKWPRDVPASDDWK